MGEPTEMEGAAINGMWGAEEERDDAEKKLTEEEQRTTLLRGEVSDLEEDLEVAESCCEEMEAVLRRITEAPKPPAEPFARAAHVGEQWLSFREIARTALRRKGDS